MLTEKFIELAEKGLSVCIIGSNLEDVSYEIATRLGRKLVPVSVYTDIVDPADPSVLYCIQSKDREIPLMFQVRGYLHDKEMTCLDKPRNV